jgi:hypothetical protein
MMFAPLLLNYVTRTFHSLLLRQDPVPLKRAGPNVHPFRHASGDNRPLRTIKDLPETACETQSPHVVHIRTWLSDTARENAPNRKKMEKRNKNKTKNLKNTDCLFICSLETLLDVRIHQP